MELTSSQLTDVAEIIGSALDSATTGVSGRYGGELWLRDARPCRTGPYQQDHDLRLEY